MCDAIYAASGVLNVPVIKSMLSYAQNARMQYMQALDKNKKIVAKTAAVEANQAKRKHNYAQAVALNVKKQRLEQDIEVLNKSANELAEKAEATGDFWQNQIPLREVQNKKLMLSLHW